MNYYLKILKNPDKQNLTDILRLYVDEGWWESEEDTNEVLEIIKGSHIFVTAFLNERIVGMGRAISDGRSDAYIQDVTVDKEFRGNNIGSLIIKKITDTLIQQNILWIGLISEKNSHPFYEKLGFKEMKNTLPMKLQI